MKLLQASPVAHLFGLSGIPGRKAIKRTASKMADKARSTLNKARSALDKRFPTPAKTQQRAQLQTPARIPSKAVSARAAERARCAKIIRHGIANGCIEQADYLAFQTELPAAAALDALKVSALDKRRNGRSQLYASMEKMAHRSAWHSVADAIVNAGNRRRGEV